MQSNLGDLKNTASLQKVTPLQETQLNSKIFRKKKKKKTLKKKDLLDVIQSSHSIFVRKNCTVFYGRNYQCLEISGGLR